MAKPKQNEMKAAQVMLIKSQAVSLVLKESFPYFKYTCGVIVLWLVGPTSVTAAKSLLKSIGVL
jgi:hypothetical protein